MYHVIIFTGILQSPSSIFKPLGAYRIRTELESQGYNVKVIDHYHNLTEEHIQKAFEKYVGKETLWVGFSTTFLNTTTLLADRSHFYMRLRKKYNVPIVIGGAKAMVEFLPWADIFITGYADDAVVSVTNHLAQKGSTPKWKDYKGKKIIDSNHEYDRKDLSNIGVVWKAEDGISPTQALPMEIARGCIFNCAFCNFPLNNKSKFDYVRVKEDMTNEFLRNYEQFGTTYYCFMDDTYNDSMKKLELMHDVITNLPFKIKFDTYIKPELIARWPDQMDLLVETGLTGASLGLETLNEDARQAIQKGKDVEKVLSAIENFKSKNNGQVKIQCNMIVGLPHESVKSLWDSNKKIINNKSIDWWNWYALQIHSKDHHEYHSPIDRNPEKFGYEISQTKLIKNNRVDTNFWLTDWKNEHMNSTMAALLASKLRKQGQQYVKVAGWNCSSFESLGLDIDEHYNTHRGLVQKMPIEEMKIKKQKIVDDYIHNVIM